MLSCGKRAKNEGISKKWILGGFWEIWRVLRVWADLEGWWRLGWGW